jgi:hypothetical protein
VLSITGCENRTQAALIFSFIGHIFVVLPCWLVTDICNVCYFFQCWEQGMLSIVVMGLEPVVNSNLHFLECWNSSVCKFSWILPRLKVCHWVTDICCTCYIGILGLSFPMNIRILFSSEHFQYKLYSWKMLRKLKWHSRRTSCSIV